MVRLVLSQILGFHLILTFAVFGTFYRMLETAANHVNIVSKKARVRLA